jgi:hypothetical protein
LPAGCTPCVGADGIYFNIRLEDAGNNKQCILVLMGASEAEKKGVVVSGF